MSEKLEIAKEIISGNYSIIVAVIGAAASLLIARHTARSTVEIKIKDIQHSLVVSLYEKRYNTYTELLDITQDIGRASIMTKIFNNSASERLKEWQRKSGGFLLLSKPALECFDELRKALNKEPRDGEKGGYSPEQIKKINRLRNEFRKALRDDFDFFHKAEDGLRYSLYSFFERMQRLWRNFRNRKKK